MHTRLAAVGVRERRSHLDVDLSGVEWLDPLHLAYAASLAHRAHRAGLRPRLRPLPEEQATYAARMRLGQAFEQFDGEHALPAVRERDRSDTLHEVRRIENPTEVRQLASLVLERVLPVDRDAAEALFKGIAEIGGNVCDHSQAGLGFVAAQTAQTKGQLRFAVADAGVGMLGTLRVAGAEDHRTAINMALSGTSSTGLPGHGTGLPSTLVALTDLDGSVLLASGDAATTANRRGRQHSVTATPVHGTVFEGLVHTVAGKHRASGG